MADQTVQQRQHAANVAIRRLEDGTARTHARRGDDSLCGAVESGDTLALGTHSPLIDCAGCLATRLSESGR